MAVRRAAHKSQTNHTACPPDGVQATLQHANTCGKFLPAASNIIDTCFPVSDQQAPTDAARLVEQQPAQSLVTPQGILAWCAIVANWTVQNMARKIRRIMFCGWVSCLSGLLSSRRRLTECQHCHLLDHPPSLPGTLEEREGHPLAVKHSASPRLTAFLATRQPQHYPTLRSAGDVCLFCS